LKNGSNYQLRGVEKPLLELEKIRRLNMYEMQNIAINNITYDIRPFIAIAIILLVIIICWKKKEEVK